MRPADAAHPNRPGALPALSETRWPCRSSAPEEALTVSVETTPDILAVDEALQSLAAVDPRKSQIVELRFFGGLTVEETADVLQISPETVLCDWRLAKAWLIRELRRDIHHEA
jgi:DNA-directed RNA polymerase specialized sigma24 family protein